MSYLKHRRGQGLVEYIILIALMGLALIVVIKTLSSNTHDKFQKAANDIQSL